MKFQSVDEIWVWRESVDLCVELFGISENVQLTNYRDQQLFNHLCRTAVSIPSNIAEGYERGSLAEFRKFLYIARGSCSELKTQLLITGRVDKRLDEKANILIDRCKCISAGLYKLIQYLSKKSDIHG